MQVIWERQSIFKYTNYAKNYNIIRIRITHENSMVTRYFLTVLYFGITHSNYIRQKKNIKPSNFSELI